MAAIKRYYWLKLDKDFFRQKEIKKLRKIAGGDTYTIIYLKLQLLSLKNAGVLVFEEVEDDFASEIALEIDEDIENVKVTIAFLLKYGLIEEYADFTYLLPRAVGAIGGESAGAERVRRHREKEKALQCNVNVTKLKQSCNVEQEQDIETDIDKEQQHRDVNSVDNSQSYDDSVAVLCEKCNLKVSDMDEHLEKYGENYVKTKLLLLSLQKNVKNKGAWLRRALENDYQVRNSTAKADANCKKCHGIGYITFFENLTKETCKIKCDCATGR